MTHLTPGELVDAVDATLSPQRQAHVQSCPECAAQVAELAVLLRETKTVQIPEPSPLFWDHLSSRVRAAIAAEDPVASPTQVGVLAWLRWSVLAPIGALALLLLALASGLPVRPEDNPYTSADLTVTSAAADDLTNLGAQEWALVSEIVGSIDLDSAQEAGIAVNPGDAERVALSMSDAERRELLRLIKEEMDRPGG